MNINEHFKADTPLEISMCDFKIEGSGVTWQQCKQKTTAEGSRFTVPKYTLLIPKRLKIMLSAGCEVNEKWKTEEVQMVEGTRKAKGHLQLAPNRPYYAGQTGQGRWVEEGPR